MVYNKSVAVPEFRKGFNTTAAIFLYLTEEFIVAEELDYTPDLYTLIDDEGNEQTFEMLDAMEVDDQQYFALTPFYDDPEKALQDDGEVIILKSVIDENGEEIMVSIDDDDEYEKIGNMFMERIEDMFEFDDEEDDCCGEEGCDCHHHLS